jgi:hypothetical protein
MMIQAYRSVHEGEAALGDPVNQPKHLIALGGWDEDVTQWITLRGRR